MRRHELRSVVWFALCSLGFLVSGASAAEPTEKRNTGPWDVESLKKTPEATWGEKSELVQEVWYESEPWKGKPTRVFAYYGRPKSGDGPFPAMLLVHGGGGKAFREWAELWAKRGYVALAMDTAGHGPDGQRLPDGGPDQDDNGKFGDFTDSDANQMWTYHAVAAVLRGHSLLASRPEVDRQRIGVTGISWGGYLTCIVAGVDDRIKVAVPVYGCGFLNDNSAWLARFAKMSPEQRDRWLKYFDPSQYLPGVRCPILFVNGTNDFAYPLDSYQKSYRLIPGPVDLCIRVRMPHGHPPGWAPQEIGWYVDSVLISGEPLARIGQMQTTGNVASAKYTSKQPIVDGQLHYASAKEPSWQKRGWITIAAKFGDGKVQAELPKDRPLVYYLTITDNRGALVSTPHAEIAESPK